MSISNVDELEILKLNVRILRTLYFKPYLYNYATAWCVGQQINLNIIYWVF